MWVWWISALLLSLLIANIVAWFLEWRSSVRITAKTKRLESSGKGHRKVPVTIITGFLGAGKTTLVNRILSDPKHGYRVAIIENEFGSISIDHSLLQKSEKLDGTNIFMTINGCMCCSSQSSANEVENILDTLLRLASVDQYDYVIVETSGLADPGPIIQTMMRMGGGKFFIDGVVTLVDAKNISSHLEGSKYGQKLVEAERQLAYADVVVINKVDLLEDPAEITLVEERIKRVNPGTSIVHSERSAVDLRLILNRNAYGDQLGNVAETIRKGCGSAKHTSRVSSVSLRDHGRMDINKTTDWLSKLVDTHWKDLYRFKGIISVAGSHKNCVVQGVMDTFTITLNEVPSHANELNEMVFIGRRLQEMGLAEGFKNCFLDGSDAMKTRDLSNEDKKSKKKSE